MATITISQTEILNLLKPFLIKPLIINTILSINPLGTYSDDEIDSLNHSQLSILKRQINKGVNNKKLKFTIDDVKASNFTIGSFADETRKLKEEEIKLNKQREKAKEEKKHIDDFMASNEVLISSLLEYNRKFADYLRRVREAQLINCIYYDAYNFAIICIENTMMFKIYKSDNDKSLEKAFDKTPYIKNKTRSLIKTTPVLLNFLLMVLKNSDMYNSALSILIDGAFEEAKEKYPEVLTLFSHTIVNIINCEENKHRNNRGIMDQYKLIWDIAKKYITLDYYALISCSYKQNKCFSPHLLFHMVENEKDVTKVKSVKKDKTLLILLIESDFLIDNITTENIKMLVERKIDINAVDIDGNTALHHLVKKAIKPEYVKLLLDLGAKTNIKNKNEEYPLNTYMKTRNIKNEKRIWEYNETIIIDLLK